jgi:hypothetical protein
LFVCLFVCLFVRSALCLVDDVCLFVCLVVLCKNKQVCLLSMPEMQVP